MQTSPQDLLMAAVDLAASAVPQKRPDKIALDKCRIISHRGENDNRQVFENTLAAFRNARNAGVWGIECDIRWTADLVPVIHHDLNCHRLFNDPARLAELDFASLRKRFPLIPSLQEVVNEFGGNTHLMLEIKQEHYPQPSRQQAILEDILAILEPGRDYHWLMLDPVLQKHVNFTPREVSLLVAQFNVRQLSRAALQQGFGGLTGHYLLLNGKLQQKHVSAGQHIGTGFVHSRNVLYKELNRGIEWIFSNRAVNVQKVLENGISDTA